MTDVDRIVDVLHEAAETHHVVWRISDRGTTKNRFDVVVVGGGTAGLTSALAARHDGAEVALIERSTTCATPCKHERGQAEPDDVQSKEPDTGLDRSAPCRGEDVRAEDHTRAKTSPSPAASTGPKRGSRDSLTNAGWPPRSRLLPVADSHRPRP